MTAVESPGRRDGRLFCGAAKRHDGGVCTQPAGWGTDHVGVGRCKLHGGSTPGQRKQAQRVLQERLAAQFGRPRVVDPGPAILEEIHRTAGLVDWYGQRIRDLDPDADPGVLSWGRSSKTDKGAGQFPGSDVTWTAAPPVLVELWMAERKHLVEVCAAALRAGVEERRVRLAESQGSLLASAVHRILEQLGLSDEQLRLVPEVVPRELRALTMGEQG